TRHHCIFGESFLEKVELFSCEACHPKDFINGGSGKAERDCRVVQLIGRRTGWVQLRQPPKSTRAKRMKERVETRSMYPTFTIEERGNADPYRQRPTWEAQSAAIYKRRLHPNHDERRTSCVRPFEGKGDTRRGTHEHAKRSRCGPRESEDHFDV